jgi:Holliday junction resolvase
MSGARHRRKGDRGEREVAKYAQGRGIAAERIPLSGSCGGRFNGDISVPLLSRDFIGEVKVRRNDFRRLYDWLVNRDLLFIRADRREWLVITRLTLATDIALVAEQQKNNPRDFCQPAKMPASDDTGTPAR